jgi:hypothetical protein
VLAPEDTLPEGHPAQGKGMVNGVPTVYICQRSTVSQPIIDPVQLDQILQLPRNLAQQQQQRRAG